MAIPDTSGGGGGHVRCPKCHSVLREPAGVPVYQCGGCGASLKAKIRSGDAQAAPSSESVSPSPRPSQSRRLGSGDVASASAPASAPDAPTTSGQGADTTSQRETGDLTPTRKHRAPASTPDAPPTTSSQGAGTSGKRETGDLTPTRKHHTSVQSPPSVEKRGHDHRSEADGSSGRHRRTGAMSAPSASANFSRGSRDAAAELQDSERRRGAQPQPVDDATPKGGSGEAARPRPREAAPMSARAAESRSAPAAVSWKRRDDAEEKAPSLPPRHAVMSPLHEKILKTVDELKDDLSELFSKSPEQLKPSTPPRTPRHPAQESHASRPPVPTSRARHAAAAAALHRRGNAGHAGGNYTAPRGLPSRRYRRCRADPCGGHDARPAGPCHRHGCCGHGKPECGSCRGHCCGSSRAREPARPPAAVQEAKRRAPPPPKHHCRPVLKGAPFIVCSSCFTLVQVPAGFAVASARVRDLRCGACSAVLSYSYRDPDRKKPAGSSPARHGAGAAGARPDLFSFIEDFAGGVSSYSTTEDDERPLHVSRNSSFDTVVATAGPRPHGNSLHRLMGYGSASELLLRRSPSLYEYGSFDRRSTPPSNASRRHDDRKGKGICLDTDDDDVADDDGGALRGSNVRAAGWRHGEGIPAPGAIRIRS